MRAKNRIAKEQRRGERINPPDRTAKQSKLQRRAPARRSRGA
jgi:hypothetical protein